jgi:iron complex transport system permease protein
MTANPPRIVTRLIWTACALLVVLLAAVLAGISAGSSGGGMLPVLQVILGKSDPDSMLHAIIWQIRLPRVLLAALVGATLALGGLVFQALLRNLLAEPYILGISGGSAIGAIAGGFAVYRGRSGFAGSSALPGGTGNRRSKRS